MATRLFTTTLARSRPLGSRSFATQSEFPKESFGGNAWRNALIAVGAVVIWFQVDKRISGSGEDKHPITKWVEKTMSSTSENDRASQEALDASSKAAEYRLIYHDAQRAPIYRMRYPESFERASPRGLTAGTQVDLSDLKVRSD